MIDGDIAGGQRLRRIAGDRKRLPEPQTVERQHTAPRDIPHAGDGTHFVLDGLVEAARRSAVGYGARASGVGNGRVITPVNTSVAREPLSMFWSVIRVRSSRPAPHSTSTAAATCTDTRPLRSQPPRRVIRPSDDTASARRPRVDCQAGARPNTMPTAKAVSAHTAATRPSNDNETALGNTPGE